MSQQHPENMDPEAILATLEHVTKTIDMLSGVVHRLNDSLHQYMANEHEDDVSISIKNETKNLH